MEEEEVEYDGGVVQEWHRNASRIRGAPGVAVIPHRAFMDCHNLRVVDLCNVTTISNIAFAGCSSLERVVWTTASAVEIGQYAFYKCERLRAIDLSNVTKIGKEAFHECNALTSVTIQSVVDIEEGAFQFCNSLAEVELGEGIQRIGDRAFVHCKSLVRITIPPSVTDIEDSAFEGCIKLAEVELKEGLQTIEPSAFWRCQSLERITIPSSVTRVGTSAFRVCTSLAEVTLCEGVQLFYGGVFGGGVFDGCTALEHINIPPVALVIDIRGGSCQLMRSMMPVTLGWKLVVSKWMQYRSPSQIEQAVTKVNEILDRDEPRVEELIPEDEHMEETVVSIRNWFGYYNMLDVTTMLELAIWKANMDGNQEQDMETRQARRRSCGNDMSVIIPGVLDCLDLGV